MFNEKIDNGALIKLQTFQMIHIRYSNFSTKLFTKLNLGVNCLTFLLPIVIPPSLQIEKVFCKHHELYLLSGKFHSWMKLSLMKKKKKKNLHSNLLKHSETERSIGTVPRAQGMYHTTRNVSTILDIMLWFHPQSRHFLAQDTWNEIIWEYNNILRIRRRQCPPNWWIVIYSL